MISLLLYSIVLPLHAEYDANKSNKYLHMKPSIPTITSPNAAVALVELMSEVICEALPS